jgi:hypothetical protein
MNGDSITATVLLIEKYRKQMKETSIYIEYAVLKEVVEDLEQLKDVLKKDNK